MKYTGYVALLLLAGCAAIPNTKQADCHQQAEDRYSLYNNKQGTFPVSEQERQNVFNTLYNQCMSKSSSGYLKEADTRNVNNDNVRDDTDSAAPNPPPVGVSMWGQPSVSPSLQEKTQVAEVSKTSNANVPNVPKAQQLAVPTDAELESIISKQ